MSNCPECGCRPAVPPHPPWWVGTAQALCAPVQAGDVPPAVLGHLGRVLEPLVKPCAPLQPQLDQSPCAHESPAIRSP